MHCMFSKIRASPTFASPRGSSSLQKRSAKYAVFHDLAAIVSDQRFRAAAFDQNQMLPADNVIVVHNCEDVPMHLFVENDNKRLSEKLITLPAGQFFMLYDMPKVEGVNGAMQALVGCDKKGNLAAPLCFQPKLEISSLHTHCSLPLGRLAVKLDPTFDLVFTRLDKHDWRLM